MKKQSLIFSSLLVLALTMLVSISAQAQAFDPLTIAGPVTAYSPADCGKAGSITIAGQNLVIAAGADTFFIDVMQVIFGDGTLGNANVKSEVWQVVGTGRLISVYLDPQNRIRLHTTTSTPTTVLSLDITGMVGAVSATSITIHGLTFPVVGAFSPAPPVVGSFVRVSGALNAGNQLTGTVLVRDPYRKVTICGAPANYRSPGITFEVADVNAFDPESPIANQVFVFNPLGAIGTQFVCDESVESLTVDGATSIPFAPNFTLRQSASKDVNACFDLNIDSRNWISNGSKKTSPASPVYGTVSGTLESFVLAATTFPTTLSETGQRGSVRISGVTFTVASGNAITRIGGPVNGDPVCLRQVVDASGQTVPFLTGQQAPSRIGFLLNGSTLTKGLCP